jgi:hypothetical protein
MGFGMAAIILRLVIALVLCPLFSSGQAYQSVIITEIMADPTPVIGLPEVEYIEIYNNSDNSISLKDWKLEMGSRSVKLPDSIIPARSYVIVCHRNNSPVLLPYGTVIGLNTFSLTNDGMLLSLFNVKNQLVYSVTYQARWWEAGKRNGGYALEIVDVGHPCGGQELWQTSVNETGGTPGKPNSIQKQLIDISPPVLERVDISGNKEFSLFFNKKLDSLNAVSAAIIEFAGRKILRREVHLPDFKTLTFVLDEPILADQEYRLTIRNLADCAGNILRDEERMIALPVDADSADVVINEILFNPFEGGVDFVEFYNTSSRHVTLKNWSLGTRRSDNSISYVTITDQNVVLPAHGYLVLTSDVAVVKAQYPSDKSRFMLEIPSFPAYANASGEVLLRNQNQLIFDRFSYSEKMHHALLSNYKGVSLEKMNPGKSSDDASNWHSASSTSGYATPGFANSQFNEEIADETFSAVPEIFTPNGDGIDDSMQLTYRQNVAGRMAAIRIFNVNGRMVRFLANNQLMGTSGFIEWDGTDDRGAVVETGYYFIVAEMFTTDGSTKRFRCKVVVATRER